MQRNNIDESIIRAYDIKLSSLNEELLHSRRLFRRMTEALADVEKQDRNKKDDALTGLPHIVSWALCGLCSDCPDC